MAENIKIVGYEIRKTTRLLEVLYPSSEDVGLFVDGEC